MSFARTVLGDVDVRELGRVNAHEHLAIRNGLIVREHPEYRLDDAQRGTEEAGRFRAAGGGTIVEATPCGAGRDPAALAQIARAAQVHVIASTGFHKESYYLDSHWRFRYGAEQIAALWRDEIADGMDEAGFEGPRRERSAARAGLIKIATDYQQITKGAQRAIEAAGLTHKMTGAPVLTHSEVGTMMPEQVEMLGRSGVRPEHIVVSHADRNPDWFVHRDVAQTGAFLEYDCPGRIKYYPESVIVELLRRMCELGLGGQILLGGDNARRSYWEAYGGGPGLAYVRRAFVPRLLAEGFSQDVVDRIEIRNAARAFAFADRDESRA